MRKLAASILIVLMPVAVLCQLEPLSSQYLLNTLAINPAYAGSREALSVVATHRNQWTGFDGAPSTVSLALHTPLRNEKIGLGILAVSDQRGVSTANILTGNFAYRIETAKGTFSMGLAGGLTFLKNKWNMLVAVDPDDALIPGTAEAYLLPDFSLGSYYYSERFFVGFSMPMFLSHNFDSSSGTFRLENNYKAYNFLLNSGYLFRPASTVKLLPSVLIRYSPVSRPQVDLNFHLILYDKIQTGISFRSNTSVVGLLMYHVNRQLALAYSYDLGLGKVGGFMGSSHEIVIRYDFRYVIDVLSPRYF